jgi:regulator of protease activity HflC (stomatin/prohibitin superfamily)
MSKAVRLEVPMAGTLVIIAALLVILLIVLARLSIRIVQQYERGVVFRFGRVVGVRDPGFT